MYLEKDAKDTIARRLSDVQGFHNLFFPGVEKVNRYPLTNISIDDEQVIHIEVACAGFTRSEISLEMEGNVLNIIGSKPDNERTNVKYLQKHISSDDFVREISFHDRYVGGDVDASLANGLLYITIKPNGKMKSTIQIK
jgi:HSP20 family molecular chaperone IbpA